MISRETLRGLVMITATLLLASNSPAPADEFPHAPLILDGVTGQAEFHIIGDSAALTFRSADGTVQPLRLIETPDDSLALLADPRVSFAEPALLAWAGSDLVAQRDRMLARAKAAQEINLPTMLPQSQAERWSGGMGLTATLQYLRVLRSVGKTDEAIAYLRDRLVQSPVGSPLTNDHTQLTIRLANIMFERGQTDEAIVLLDAESKALPAESDLRTNLDINLAALLARSGHYQRAFTLVDVTWRDFAGAAAGQDDSDWVTVPGSGAQFAWIRACALNGLGRKEQAASLMAAITDVPAEMPGAMMPTTSARIRGYKCMKDSDALARELAAQVAVAVPASDILVKLDPLFEDYGPDRAVLVTALRSPLLAKAMAGHVRSLSRFAPAVSHWR